MTHAKCLSTILVGYLWRIAAALLIIVCVPTHGQARSSQTNFHKAHAKAAQKPAPEVPANTPASTVNVINQEVSNQKEHVGEERPRGYLSRLFSAENLPQIGLFLAGVAGIIVAMCTLRTISRQTAHIGRQAQSMRYQTTHLKNSATQARMAAEAAKASSDALIASERAWIDGELVQNRELLDIRSYSLRIRNLGKTPAQIRSYTVGVGPVKEDGVFSPESLTSEKTISLHIFIGSGESEDLEKDIDMDEAFPSNDDIGMGKGPYRVVIKYADVVTGTPDNREEHETSFIYLYRPLTQSVERLSVFNKYS